MIDVNRVDVIPVPGVIVREVNSWEAVLCWVANIVVASYANEEFVTVLCKSVDRAVSICVVGFTVEVSAA